MPANLPATKPLPASPECVLSQCKYDKFQEKQMLRAMVTNHPKCSLGLPSPGMNNVRKNISQEGFDNNPRNANMMNFRKNKF